MGRKDLRIRLFIVRPDIIMQGLPQCSLITVHPGAKRCFIAGMRRLDIQAVILNDDFLNQRRTDPLTVRKMRMIGYISPDAVGIFLLFKIPMI